MSVLFRYTTREILSHIAGVLAVVLGVFLVRRCAALIGDAAEGSIAVATVFELLGLRTLMALPSLLPVVLYLAVLLSLGRLYQDLEMTALAACGVAPGQVQRNVIAFALLAAVVIGVLSFSVRPWAALRYDALEDQTKLESGIGQIRPGRFYELDADGEQVVFAESRSTREAGVIEGVFVQQRKGERLSIFAAARAVEEHDAVRGYRFLRLLDGTRYDLRGDGDDYEITEYDELVIRTTTDPVPPAGPEEKEVSLWALARAADPEAVAELQWRLAMPISAVILALFALPLSRVEPRQGKYAKILVAVLIYLAYRQLLGTAKSWMADGVLPPLPGIWAVHAVALAVALTLLASERWELTALWRRAR